MGFRADERGNGMSRLKFNRFAIVPIMCPRCHRYIWLEKYRRADVFNFGVGRYWKTNICSDCIKEYDVKEVE